MMKSSFTQKEQKSMLSALPQNFATIVETGSITRAADRLETTKSAVSQNLKRLENELGVKLVIRTTRRMSLTPAGERYYKHCKDLLTLTRQAKTEMEAFGASPSGPIKVTAPHALIGPVLAPALAEVTRRFPRLTPEVIAEDRRLNLIAEGIDLAISVGDLPDSSLKARRVGELRDILCVAPSLMRDAPGPDDPDFRAWVQSLPYIAHTREPGTVEHVMPASERSDPLKLRFSPTLHSNTIEAMAAFAREGLGVALLPNISVAADLEAGRLTHLCGSLRPDPTPIYAVHAYGSLAPKSVSETIDAVQTIFARARL